MQLILGVPLGILASLLAWYVLFHVVKPSIGFYAKISKYQGKENNSYRVKFINNGKRSIIDLEVFVRTRTKGIGRYKNIWNIVDLETSVSRLPILVEGGSRIVRIYPERTEKYLEPLWGKDINGKLRNGKLTLEDILRLGDKAQLRIYVFGFDEFSGSRRLFRSKWYELSDIEEKEFSKIAVEKEANKKNSLGLQKPLRAFCGRFFSALCERIRGK